jgi:3-oxoacyl-[acyl-carrier protein] reductase
VFVDLGIKGKYAVVTGGSHGIGLSIALALAEEGCNVAICARGEDRLEDAKKAIIAKNVDCIAIKANVLIPEDIQKVLQTVIDRWGTVDILINNAGGGGRWGSDDILMTPEDVWKDVYDKNVSAAVRFTVLALPHMKKRKWGRVITISSIHGRQAGGRPWFNIAKCAETVLMKNLAMKPEFVRYGITFNSIAPGCILIPDTGWHKEQAADPERFEDMLDREFPLGRMGTSEEVAHVVVFACSKQAAFLNGASIVVDGGESRVF